MLRGKLGWTELNTDLGETGCLLESLGKDC